MEAKRPQGTPTEMDAGTRQELAALKRELEQARDLLRTSTVSYVRGRLDVVLTKLEELLNRSDSTSSGG